MEINIFFSALMFEETALKEVQKEEGNKKGSVLLHTFISNLDGAKAYTLIKFADDAKLEGAEGTEDILRNRFVVHRKLCQKDESSKTLCNSMRTDASSWEGRPSRSYRLGTERLGSSSVEKALGSWLAPNRT